MLPVELGVVSECLLRNGAEMAIINDTVIDRL